MCAKFNWAQLDVTRRSIEETAAAILKLFTTGSGNGLQNDAVVRKGFIDIGVAKPGAANAARRCRPHLRDRARRIDERAIQQASGLSAPADIAALLAREKIPVVSTRRSGRYVIGATRRWRWGHSSSASRSAERRLPSNCVRSLAKVMSYTRRLAVARDGKILFEKVAIARYDHAA